MSTLDLQAVLNSQKTKLLMAIKEAKKARSEAPTATESYSDQSRYEADKLVHAFEDDLSKLEALSTEISIHKPTLYHLKNDQAEKQFLLVPEGLGGQMIGSIQTISGSSPIGQKLTSTKIGDYITIGGTDWVLV